jgi:divalent metal cation (Fe/Co/Zn/Cd) transporter
MGAGLLLYGAWEVSTSSVNDLLDASLEEASQLLIMRKLAEHFDDFESVLKIRTRRSGTNIYIEVFLGFNADMTLMMVQEKMRHIANDIQNNFPGAEVVIVPSVA